MGKGSGPETFCRLDVRLPSRLIHRDPFQPAQDHVRAGQMVKGALGKSKHIVRKGCDWSRKAGSPQLLNLNVGLS